ncbi:hypothetical protein CsatB_029454 [Cannabis sativa]
MERASKHFKAGQGETSSRAQVQGKPICPPGFSQQPRAQKLHPPQGSQSSSLEILMRDYMAKNDDILIKKRRLDEFEMVALIEGCNAMLKSKIPSKLKDLGSFTIPCFIGGTDVRRALCDLRASINLMSVSIFKQLGIGEARSTTVTLQLADRSMGHVEGKIGICY